MIFRLFSGGEKKRITETVAAARAGNTEKVKQILSNGGHQRVGAGVRSYATPCCPRERPVGDG